MDKDTFTANVLPEVLSDNSVTHNVIAHIYGEIVTFECIDEAHATQLAGLINDCTYASVK